MKKQLIRQTDRRGFFSGEWFPFAVFAVCVLTFMLAETRLFVKMDDGNFLAIANAPSFTYSGWLKTRYETLSGRTTGEFLMMFFLRHNLVWWKLCNTGLIVYTAWFFRSLGRYGKGEQTAQERMIFSCCAMFLMVVSALNPAVFWFAGSFSYLWPFAGLCMTVHPLLSALFENRVKTGKLVLAFFAAVLAVSQEQAAACTLALYVILLAVLIKNRRFKGRLLAPLVPAVLLAVWLFRSPGAKLRGGVEAAGSFPRYAQLGFFGKLQCGASQFFANSFYLSVILQLVFLALLTTAVSAASPKKKTKRILIACMASAAAICVGLNGVLLLVTGKPAHVLLRTCCLSGRWTGPAIALFAGGCLMTLMAASLLLWLTVLRKKTGAAVLLCCLAGFGSAMAMSFSASVFSSGQRTSFYTNMFLAAACVILFSNLPAGKPVRAVYRVSAVAAAGTFILDVFAFRFAELPLMG